MHDVSTAIPLELTVSVTKGKRFAEDLSGAYYGTLPSRTYKRCGGGGLIRYSKEDQRWILQSDKGTQIARSRGKQFALSPEAWEVRASDKLHNVQVHVMQVLKVTHEMPRSFAIEITSRKSYEEYLNGTYIENKGVYIAGARVYRHQGGHIYAHFLDEHTLAFAQTLEIREQGMLAFGHVSNLDIRTCTHVTMRCWTGEVFEAVCNVKADER